MSASTQRSMGYRNQKRSNQECRKKRKNSSKLARSFIRSSKLSLSIVACHFSPMKRSVPLMLSIIVGSVLSLAAIEVHDHGVPAASPAAQHSNQSKELRNKQAYANSLKELDAIIRSSPNIWRSDDVRANLFMQKGNWPAALQDLNSTIRLQPAFFEASWKRSIVYLHLRNYAASLKDLMPWPK